MKLKQLVLFVFLLGLPSFVYPKLREHKKGFKWLSKSNKTDLFEDIQNFYNEVLLQVKSYQMMIDGDSVNLKKTGGKEKKSLDAKKRENVKELNRYLQKKDKIEKEIISKINSGNYDLNTKNERGITFLSWAIMNDCSVFLPYALSNGANPVLLSDDGMNSLHVACEMESGQAIETITKYIKSLLNSQDNKGNTPLHYLVTKRGRPYKIKMLLSCRPDLKIKNKRGELPVDIARKSKRKDIINALK